MVRSHLLFFCWGPTWKCVDGYGPPTATEEGESGKMPGRTQVDTFDLGPTIMFLNEVLFSWALKIFFENRWSYNDTICFWLDQRRTRNGLWSVLATPTPTDLSIPSRRGWVTALRRFPPEAWTVYTLISPFKKKTSKIVCNPVPDFANYQRSPVPGKKNPFSFFLKCSILISSPSGSWSGILLLRSRYTTGMRVVPVIPMERGVLIWPRTLEICRALCKRRGGP